MVRRDSSAINLTELKSRLFQLCHHHCHHYHHHLHYLHHDHHHHESLPLDIHDLQEADRVLASKVPLLRRHELPSRLVDQLLHVAAGRQQERRHVHLHGQQLLADLGDGSINVMLVHKVVVSQALVQTWYHITAYKLRKGFFFCEQDQCSTRHTLVLFRGQS